MFLSQSKLSEFSVICFIKKIKKIKFSQHENQNFNAFVEIQKISFYNFYSPTTRTMRIEHLFIYSKREKLETENYVLSYKFFITALQPTIILFHTEMH